MLVALCLLFGVVGVVGVVLLTIEELSLSATTKLKVTRSAAAATDSRDDVLLRQDLEEEGRKRVWLAQQTLCKNVGGTLATRRCSLHASGVC